MFMKALQLFFLLLIAHSNVFSQSINGIVVEKGTDTPLVGAHIYIINSLQGAVSNSVGNFSLTPPNEYGELLITYIGYEDLKIEFSPTSKKLIITLTPLTNQLEEIAVKSTEDKKWKRLYKKFESAFLGTTDNAALCVIKNPWVVDVSKGADGEIIAKSIQPIEIENNALGYELTFYLEGFTLKGDRLHYKGFVFFDELNAKNGAQKNSWVRNRGTTFLGSKNHFINSLNSRSLEKEGFEIYEAEFSPGIGFTTGARKRESKLLKTDHELLLPDYLKIVYTNAQPQRAYITQSNSQQSIAFQGPKADLVPKGNLQMSTQSTNNQVSYLYSRNSKLIFMDNGYVVNNKYIIEYGYWSWLGVAEMMPYEYDYMPIID